MATHYLFMYKESFFKKHYLILWQLILLSIVALFFIFTNNWLGFKSALLGGSAWIIPSLYFTWKLHRAKTIRNHQDMLKSFFSSEAIKLLLSFGIITLILLTFTIDEVSFLGGYIAMTSTSLLIPFGHKIRK